MADEVEVESFGPPEPVAPWNWSSIPDYGPVQQYQHVLAFLFIGVSMTLVYEYTTYFDQVSREFAYPLIWFAIFFRLLAHLSPRELSEEEEIAAREKAEQIAFKKRLVALANEDDENDDENDETKAQSAEDALHAKKQQ